MIAYLDASVVLRLVSGDPGQLCEWPNVDKGVASALTEVKCLRPLDRFMRQEAHSVDELAERRTAVYRLFERCDVVEVAPSFAEPRSRSRHL